MADLADFFRGGVQTYVPRLIDAQSRRAQFEYEEMKRQRALQEQAAQAEQNFNEAIRMEQELQRLGLGRYYNEPTVPFEFSGEVIPAYTTKEAIEIVDGLPTPSIVKDELPYGFARTSPNQVMKVDIGMPEDEIDAEIKKQRALEAAGLKVNPVEAEKRKRIAEMVEPYISANIPIPSGLAADYEAAFGYPVGYSPAPPVSTTIPQSSGMFDAPYPEIYVPGGGYSGDSGAGFPTGAMPAYVPEPSTPSPPGVNLRPMEGEPFDIAANVSEVIRRAQRYGPMEDLPESASVTNEQRIAYDEAAASGRAAQQRMDIAIAELQGLNPKDAANPAKVAAIQRRIIDETENMEKARVKMQEAVEKKGKETKEEKKTANEKIESLKKGYIKKQYSYQGGDPNRQSNYYSYNDFRDELMATTGITNAQRQDLLEWARKQWFAKGGDKAVQERIMQQTKGKKGGSKGQQKTGGLKPTPPPDSGGPIDFIKGLFQ